ncbi:hypothetical protein BC832DRAFT_541856 [Gaertneriomyces semiglobifer]|nr:hypothetical protein BC832DRAFT_541856 [Gaertneriomyces semiglobifer]
MLSGNYAIQPHQLLTGNQTHTQQQAVVHKHSCVGGSMRVSLANFAHVRKHEGSMLVVWTAQSRLQGLPTASPTNKAYSTILPNAGSNSLYRRSGSEIQKIERRSNVAVTDVVEDDGSGDDPDGDDFFGATISSDGGIQALYGVRVFFLQPNFRVPGGCWHVKCLLFIAHEVVVEYTEVEWYFGVMTASTRTDRTVGEVYFVSTEEDANFLAIFHSRQQQYFKHSPSGPKDEGW